MIVAFNAGKNNNPSWYHNLKGKETAKIQILRAINEYSIHFASAEEKVRLWSLIVNQAPFYDNYRKKTSRDIPVIVLIPKEKDE